MFSGSFGTLEFDTHQHDDDDAVLALAAYKNMRLLRQTSSDEFKVNATNLVDASVSAALCKLSLPNVVHIEGVDFLTHTGHEIKAVVAMEAGVNTLHSYVTNRPRMYRQGADYNVYRRMKKAYSVLADLVRGLHAMHCNGLVHGDVKPENIILTSNSDDFSVKLVDFGGALLVDHYDKTRRPNVRCTHRYAPPEMFLPAATTSVRASATTVDAYCLGATLYYFIYGEHVVKPDKDDADTMRRTHLADIYADPDSPGELRSRSVYVFTACRGVSDMYSGGGLRHACDYTRDN